jgi:hypothetical protein
MSKHKTHHQPREASSNNYASRLLSRMLDDRKRPGQDHLKSMTTDSESVEQVAAPPSDERQSLVELK